MQNAKTEPYTGRYTKLRPLGKGNMGVVHLVKRNTDGKVAVIKLVDISKMSKKERLASANEAKVLSSLNHPNVIHYIESFLSKKTQHLCIVMEYADGGDLSSRMKNQRGMFFSEDQIVDWFVQLCLAVEYCHKKRVIHRDIKTQNIFLTGDGICKVGDFGISRILQNTFDVAHTFVGTPYYLSPELVREEPYNQMSDIWAMGVVLYELIALKHPFNANDMKGLMQRILKSQYDPCPDHYSQALRDVIPKLLAKDPSRRLRISQILDLPIFRNRLLRWAAGLVENVPYTYITDLRSCGVLNRGPDDMNTTHEEADEEYETDYESDDDSPAYEERRKAEEERALEVERERALRDRLQKQKMINDEMRKPALFLRPIPLPEPTEKPPVSSLLLPSTQLPGPRLTPTNLTPMSDLPFAKPIGSPTAPVIPPSWKPNIISIKPIPLKPLPPAPHIPWPPLNTKSNYRPPFPPPLMVAEPHPSMMFPVGLQPAHSALPPSLRPSDWSTNRSLRSDLPHSRAWR